MSGRYRIYCTKCGLLEEVAGHKVKAVIQCNFQFVRHNADDENVCLFDSKARKDAPNLWLVLADGLLTIGYTREMARIDGISDKDDDKEVK